jgi:hypothetical protein
MASFIDPKELTIVFHPETGRVRVNNKGGAFLFTGIVNLMRGADLLRASSATLARTSFHLDECGFRFPNAQHLDWDEEEDGPLWQGVELHILEEEGYIPEPDFARLMLRVAQTFIAGAQEHDHPMLREPWWPELLHATSRLEAQVAAMGGGGEGRGGGGGRGPG